MAYVSSGPEQGPDSPPRDMLERDPRPGPAMIVGASIGLLIAIALFVAWLFIDPAPPASITLASGSPGGFYDRIGTAYQERLSGNGLKVTLRPSNGSIDNLDLLAQGEVDIAFVQGGVLPDPAPEGLVSLASIALEPLWLFTRGDRSLSELSELAGGIVAVGPDGSGTRRLAVTLLEGVGALDGLRLDPRAGDEAAAALLGGEIDAAFFVTSPRTATIRELLLSPAVVLADLDRAHGIARNFPYLSAVDIPEGTFDLKINRPREPLTLLAPATTVLARSDLHPAVIALVLDVARVVHGSQARLGNEPRFPSDEFLELPLSEEARRYFESGPTFLRRYMPFWAANLVERLWVLIIPLITIMIPLGRVAPPAYRWQVRRRIYRWYDDLRDLEKRGRAARSPEDRTAVLEALDTLDAEVGTIRVPLPYTDDLYHLRLHIEYVMRQIDGRAALAADRHQSPEAIEAR